MLTKRESRSIVEAALRWPVANYLPPQSRRYPWLRDRFVPSLRILERGNERDRLLGSRGYFELGDIFSLYFGAREAAVRAYRRAVRLDPEFGLAWHDIGFELEYLGDALGAQRAYRKAVEYAPNEVLRDWWKDAIQAISAKYVRKIRNQSDKSETTHLAYEYLAKFQPERTLHDLKNREFEESLRAAAYSALDDWQSSLDEWARRVPASNEESEYPAIISHLDYFFCTKPIERSPEFWKIMIKLSKNCDPIFVPFRSTLERLIPDPKTRRGSYLIRRQRRFRLAARLKFAETSKDKRLARAICEKYPDWDDAGKVLAKLLRNTPKST